MSNLHMKKCYLKKGKEFEPMNQNFYGTKECPELGQNKKQNKFMLGASYPQICIGFLGV